MYLMTGDIKTKLFVWTYVQMTFFQRRKSSTNQKPLAQFWKLFPRTRNLIFYQKSRKSSCFLLLNTYLNQQFKLTRFLAPNVCFHIKHSIKTSSVLGVQNPCQKELIWAEFLTDPINTHVKLKFKTNWTLS